MLNRDQEDILIKEKNKTSSELAEYIEKQKEEEKNLPEQLYEEWIRQNEWDILNVRKKEYEPLISVVIPVYNVLEEQLVECVESVRNQTYHNWELILVDDHSSWVCVKQVLQRYEHTDRITIVYREKNGNISEATNTGLEIVKGEFIAFSDCDDVLAVNALYEFVKALNRNQELDFLYSDEDKLSEDGKRRHSPFFKPDWSPDTFMSMMYTNHLALYRTELVKKTGKLRGAFNGAQDYDFTLRFLELTDNKKVCHISKVLYHWREREESTATGIEVKPYVREATRKAKEEALERRGLKGELEYVPDMGQYRVVYRNEDYPLVSIIIPSKDHFELLKQCIDSVISYTEYPNYELVVVDNGSGKEARENIERYLQDKRAVYHYEKMNFNFSRMCNMGAGLSKGEYLLFLNDDIKVTQSDWLGRMVGQASLKHVGAVGAKLYYPESRFIQHAGIILSERHGPIVPFGGMEDSIPYYFGRNRMDYNFLAVTGACLLLKKNLFEKCEGFDEKLAVAYNDVDLCMKLYEAGYYNVLRNDVILYHYESISRGIDFESKEKMIRLERERNFLFEKHKRIGRKDPFYSIHLTGDRNDFQIKGTTGKVFSKLEEIAINRDQMSESMEMNVDIVGYSENQLTIIGWGFDRKLSDNNKAEKYILLEEKGKRKKESYLFTCKNVYRPDVADVFARTDHDIELCGYEAVIPSEILNPVKRDYQISLVLKDKEKIFWKTYEKGLNDLAEATQYVDLTTVHIEPVNQEKIIEGQEKILSDIVIDQVEDGYLIYGWAFGIGYKSRYYMRITFLTASGYQVSQAVQKETRIDVARHFIQIPYILESGFWCKVSRDLLERLGEGTEGGLLFIDKRDPSRKIFKKIPKLTVTGALLGDNNHV